MDNIRESILDTFAEIEKRLDALLGKKNGKQVLLYDFYSGDTVAMTVLMSNLFEHLLPEHSPIVEGTPENQKGYDFLIEGKKVEMKMTGSKTMSAFTSAAHQSKDDAEKFMFLRYEMHPDRNKPKSLALWITPALSEMPISAEAMTKSRKQSLDAGNSNFSTIRISSEEADKIETVFGGMKKNRVWTAQVFENVE